MLSVSLIAALSMLLIACGGRRDEQVRDSIQHLIETDSTALGVDADAEHASEIRTFYRQRDFMPAWVRGRRSADRLDDLLEVLCDADEQGLNRRDYISAALQEHIDSAFDDEAVDDSSRARRLAILDVAVTNTMMRYASHVLTGRVDPRDLEATWNTPVYEANLLSIFTDTTSSASFRSLSQRKGRTHPQYGALLDALRRYRLIDSQGGWERVAPGEPLVEGAAGSRVAAVIRRLAASGDIDSSLVPSNPDSARYSERVASGVERFQRRHGMEPDGVMGEDVVTAMNVSVKERIRQLELNLERWRWIPSYLGSRYLYVNVPAFELHAVENGEEVMSMAVIVGEEYDDSATPVFSDTMEYVVFNPYWNVPRSIAIDEILPLAREDSDYLAENRYEIVADWSDEADVIPTDSRAMDLVEAGEYRIRQQPGAGNALGRIKFMFPNDFNIYLHDTPEDHLFAEARRAYSHGCIRVERPVDLARFVLTSNEWTADEIQTRMESRERVTEYLDDPVPVYILYWTAFVDEEDRIHFRDDLYGNDAELDEALEQRSSSGRTVSCDAVKASLSS